MTHSINTKPTVLVTEVSSGIGLTIAEDLRQRGYRVFDSARCASDVESLSKR